MKHNRIKLVIIFATFLAPLLAAFIWYYGLGASFAPQSQRNNAPLLTPPVALKNFSNSTVDNTQFNLKLLQQKWNLIHVLPQQCDQSCEQALYNTRQTRLALGKYADRVQRIFLSPERSLLTRLADDHPDTLRLLESANGIGEQLKPLIQNHRLGMHDALLVDPLGNVMMIIPAQLSPSLLLKDLKHLLKVSRIG